MTCRIIFKLTIILNCSILSALASPVSPLSAPPSPLPPPFPSPSLNASGIESAFAANQGDYYVYAALYGYDSTQLTVTRLVDGTPFFRQDPVRIVDGGGGVGLGLGSSSKAVAVQLGYNLSSFKRIDSGGSIDVKVSRDLIVSNELRMSFAGGVQAVYGYGDQGNTESTPYTVLTAAFPVQFEGSRRTLQVNAGYGGGKFKTADSPSILEKGVFGSVGLEVADNVGVSLGWVGRGVNGTLSVSPFRGTPLTINISANNIFDYRDLGRVGVIGVTWGGSFQTASF